LTQKLHIKEQEEEEAEQTLKSLRHHVSEQMEIIASQKD